MTDKEIRILELKARIQEIDEEIITIFHGLFTDGEYRRIWMEAMDERAKEIEKEIEELERAEP